MSCPDCFKGAMAHGTPKGEMTTIHGTSCYQTPPASTPTKKTSKILFFTDAFGLDLVNNKLLADVYADRTGCRVVAPDCIPGGPMPSWVMLSMETAMKPVAWLDVWGQLQRIWTIGSILPTAVPWMMRASPPKCLPATLTYARKFKAGMAPGEKLGVCGFCWGGYQSTGMCAEPAVEGGSERLIDCQFTAHPSALKTPDMILDAISKFKVPYSVALGDTDIVLSADALTKVEAKARQDFGEGKGEGGYNFEFKIYQDMAHGFAIRGDSEDEKVTRAMDEAASQAVDWFNKFL